jgi:hypothetical protein
MSRDNLADISDSRHFAILLSAKLPSGAPHASDLEANFIQNTTLATGNDISINECIFSLLGGNAV